MRVRSHVVFLSVLALAGLSAVQAQTTLPAVPSSFVPDASAEPTEVAGAPAPDVVKKSVVLDDVAIPLSAAEKELSTVLSQWQVDLNNWVMEYGRATPKEQAELMEKRPNGTKTAREIWRIIRPNLKESWTAPGIDWFLRNPTELSKFPPPNPEKVTNALLNAIEHYQAGDAQVKDVCPGLVKFNHPRSVPILEKIFLINKDPATKAHAALALALKLKVGGGGDDEASVKLRGGYLKYVLEKLPAVFFDMPFGEMKISDIIREELYQINNLTLNQKAPLIKATTMTGEVFDTSTMKGKVSLVVFLNPGYNEVIPVIENMERMHNTLSPQGVKMVLIFPLNQKTTQEVIDTCKLTIPVISDDMRAIHTDYRINSLAEGFLLDGSGKIRFKKTPSGLMQMAAQQLLDDTKKGVGTVRPTSPK